MPTKYRRRTTGTLSDLQRKMLPMLAQGLSHMLIAGRLNVSRTAIAENSAVMQRKAQVRNGAQLMYVYGKAEGLREAADLADAEDRHGLAGELRERAEGLLP